tara:strand:- start:1203 stop:1406 length:204 start_codon:yes stop_codon:yes gene_type:complete
MAVTVEKVKEKVQAETPEVLTEKEQAVTKKFYEKPLNWAIAIGVITVTFFGIRYIRRKNGSKIIDIE